MKKILLAFDGKHLSEGAFQFVRQLNQKQPVLLVALLIPQLTSRNLWSYTTGMAGPSFEMPDIEDQEKIKENMALFENRCRQERIDFLVHGDDYDFALPLLKKETRFADLLVIGSERLFPSLADKSAEENLAELLREAECPVVVVPEHYIFPTKTILAYDGSESSVFAIRQFAYLFPELRDKETLLVHLSEKESENLPEETLLKELLQQHFEKVTIEKLPLPSKKSFADWINHNQSSILVSGSFGRTAFSQLLKRSFARDVLAGHRLPVFIAHR